MSSHVPNLSKHLDLVVIIWSFPSEYCDSFFTDQIFKKVYISNISRIFPDYEEKRVKQLPDVKKLIVLMLNMFVARGSE